MDNPSFTNFQHINSLLYDYSDNNFPTKLYGHCSPVASTIHTDNSTVYGFVQEGLVNLWSLDNKRYNILEKGMFFSIAEPFNICGGKAILVERIGHKGTFLMGGPIENKGRLKYIDGCTDSCLIQPIKLGDPCLNALYFPCGIDQTQHTHPSMRVGIVHKGSGMCKTPFANVELNEGDIFIIHPEGKEVTWNGVKAISGVHSFETFTEEMIVIAYHPDSDFGCQDEEHPMINKTIVEGVSAKYIDEIRTK